jgi:hypothetical protein
VSFTRGQQPEFRKMLAEACKFCGIDPKGSEYRKWYEMALFNAVRKTSTTDCNAGRDYDFVMAEFEVLGQSGIKWQRKAATGDAVRMLHEIRKTCGSAADVDESYMLGIGARALCMPLCPPLHKLSREQLETILVACKQQVTREKVARGEREPQTGSVTKGVRRNDEWKRGQARKYREARALDADEPF